MAVDRNEQVTAMVEEALREEPDISNDELQERAAEIDPDVGELSARSFNARYPLQVKRKLSAEQQQKTEAAEGDEFRSTVREALLDFARDVTGARDRGKAIGVVTDVDKYVDRVMEKV